MKKPVIVLSPQAMPMEQPFRQHYHYTNNFNMSAIRRAGGLPVLPPFLDEAEALALMETADGLFLTGGDDLSPALYGQATLPACGTVDERRDASDYHLLAAALALHKPVLCLCRGCQIANVYFGGSLYQDIPTQYQTTLHHSAYDTYAQERAHTVTLVPGSPLHALLGETAIPVNSLHHQGIRTLADGLAPMAWAPDGILEGFCLTQPKQWLWGLQWHPEMLEASPRADAIFGAFLAACRPDGI